jgi:hypothetical protein
MGTSGTIPTTANAPLCTYLCIKRAQHRYGFDLPTAQRLAFVRWLRLTGRLSEESC